MPQPLRYLIGVDDDIGVDGAVTEVGYDATRKPARGIGVKYCNLFDEKNAGQYGPYLHSSDTAEEYGEGQIDPSGAGWWKNLNLQFARATAQGFEYIEVDNPDAYKLADVLGAINIAAVHGLKVMAKNPGLTYDGDDATPAVAHPNVHGIIVEKDAGTPAQMDAMRRAAGKPDLPVWFVAFSASGLPWAKATAEQAKSYSGMGVTHSPGGEYVASVNILIPKAEAGKNMVWVVGPQGRLAKSLIVLFKQIDVAYPGRSTSSDGTLGDTSHQASKSDHNPNAQKVVTALDITHDPAHGVDTYLLAEQLLKAKDERIKYCLVPGTRVLTADLDYVPIETLSIGSQLIAFDEFGPWKPWAKSGNQARMAGQRLRTATVEMVEAIQRPCFEIETDQGAVTASAEHQWLAALSLDAKYRSWIETWTLQSGIPIQFFGKPWTRETSFDAGWLSGLFDGEGCLSRPVGGGWSLSAAQRSGHILERAIFLLEQFGVDFEVYDSGPVKSLVVRGGLPSILSFLGRFRPIRLTEKAIRERIWEDRSLRGIPGVARVRGIRKVGMLDVIALQTSTRTFMAEGLFSHNCISNRKIASGTGQSNPAWKWRSYTGTNPHNMHIHISVKPGAKGDEEQPWVLDLAEVIPPVLPDMPVLKRGSTGDAVEILQRHLLVDGNFGPATEAAVKVFQKANGIVADGIVGPYTWLALLKEAKPSEPGTWMENITATMFGGAGDPNTSAYDGKMLNDTDMYCALPFRFEGTRPTIEFKVGDKLATASIQDVGPWMTNDPYWQTNARPVAEQCYQTKTALPSGPNKGKVPTNDAGIDASPALARALGIGGKGKVSWRIK